MSAEYPLYPTLTEEGEREAQAIFDSFKVRMKKLIEETLSELYTDVAPYIESDSWTNFRNQMLEGFRDYNNRKIQAAYDFKEIRQAILREHREAIIADLDQDAQEEIKQLKSTIEHLQELRRMT